MILRSYEPRDRETVMALMEAKDDQLILDPSHPANPVTVVLEDDGRVVAALVGRVKLEAHLALDHTVGHPAERLEWIEKLAEFGMEEMERAGAPSIEFAAMANHRSWVKRIENFPFAVRDDRVHFRLRKEAVNGSEANGRAGDSASAPADGGSAGRPAADPEPPRNRFRRSGSAGHPQQAQHE